MGPGTKQHQAKFWTRGTFSAQALVLFILCSPRFVLVVFSGHQDDSCAPALSKHPSPHPVSRSSSLNLILDAVGYYYYFQVNPINQVILVMKATCRGDDRAVCLPRDA